MLDFWLIIFKILISVSAFHIVQLSYLILWQSVKCLDVHKEINNVY